MVKKDGCIILSLQGAGGSCCSVKPASHGPLLSTVYGTYGINPPTLQQGTIHPHVLIRLTLCIINDIKYMYTVHVGYYGGWSCHHVCNSYHFTLWVYLSFLGSCHRLLFSSTDLPVKPKGERSADVNVMVKRTWCSFNAHPTISHTYNFIKSNGFQAHRRTPV